MFIKIDLKDDVECDEATKVARAIIDVLDDADKVPDQITEISLGGYPDIWISDEANDEAEPPRVPDPRRLARAVKTLEQSAS